MVAGSGGGSVGLRMCFVMKLSDADRGVGSPYEMLLPLPRHRRAFVAAVERHRSTAERTAIRAAPHSTG
jgi:hypothetical protein